MEYILQVTLLFQCLIVLSSNSSGDAIREVGGCNIQIANSTIIGDIKNNESTFDINNSILSSYVYNGILICLLLIIR